MILKGALGMLVLQCKSRDESGAEMFRLNTRRCVRVYECVCLCASPNTVCSSVLQVTGALEQLLALAEEKLDESASIVQIIVSRYRPHCTLYFHKDNDATLVCPQVAHYE